MAISVRLSPREEHEALILSRDTTKICRMQDTTPRGEDGRDQSDHVGCRAEFAVAKLLGLDPPKFNVLGDEGKDLWFGNQSIDVKHTGGKETDLIFDSLEAFRADAAILVTSNEGEFVVHGGVSKERFTRDAYLKSKKFGMKMCLNVSEISPIETLWKYLRQQQIKEDL